MTLYLDYVGDIRQYHKHFPYNIKANISNKHKDICSKIQTMAKCIQKIYIFKTISPLYIYIYIYSFLNITDTTPSFIIMLSLQDYIQYYWNYCDKFIASQYIYSGRSKGGAPWACPLHFTIYIYINIYKTPPQCSIRGHW